MRGLWWAFAVAGLHAIQTPGSFHAGEAVARDGERWLALRVDTRSARLEATRLRVIAVADPIGDAPGEQTGQDVRAETGGEAIVFLRGPLLRPGPVQQALSENQKADQKTGTLPEQIFALGERRYRLRTYCEAHAATGDIVGAAGALDCRIELSEGGKRQTLLSVSGRRETTFPDAPIVLGDDATPIVIFAGDLDRDGRLDLVFDTTDHYNLARPTLFLSGAAGKGELLREMAKYSAVGC